MLVARRMLILTAIFASANLGTAQNFRIGDTTFSRSTISGSVTAISTGVITVKTATQPASVIVSDQKLAELLRPIQQQEASPPRVEIVVTGSADPSFLARDQFVTFTAELQGGKSEQEVTELTLFTPTETQTLGLSSTLGGDTAATGALSGTFLVSGQVASFGKGNLTVLVPSEQGRNRRISVRVADTARIAVRAADLAFVRVGDAVSAEGFVATRDGRLPSNTLLAAKVEITLTKPLMGKGKRREPVAASERPGTDRRTSRRGKAEEEGTPQADRTQNADNLQGPKSSGIRSRSGDPSPDKLIIVDSFIVDEGSAFDEEPENASDK